MKNVVHEPGSAYAVKFTNSTGGALSSGDGHKEGTLFGVVHDDVADGAEGVMWVEGVFELPKATGGGTALTVGQIVDFTEATQLIDATLAAGDLPVGQVVKAAADGDSVAQVRLAAIRIHA